MSDFVVAYLLVSVGIFVLGLMLVAAQDHFSLEASLVLTLGDTLLWPVLLLGAALYGLWWFKHAAIVGSRKLWAMRPRRAPVADLPTAKVVQR